MSNPLVDAIIKASIEYHDHVNKRLKVMSVGKTLCVHDSVETNHPDDWKMTYVVESHIMDPSEDCDYPHRKTQFGPKGE